MQFRLGRVLGPCHGDAGVLLLHAPPVLAAAPPPPPAGYSEPEPVQYSTVQYSTVQYLLVIVSQSQESQERRFFSFLTRTEFLLRLRTVFNLVWTCQLCLTIIFKITVFKMIDILQLHVQNDRFNMTDVVMRTLIHENNAPKVRLYITDAYKFRK